MDLIARTGHEKSLLGVVERLNDEQRRELYRLVGNPPSLSNVPQEFWDRVTERNRLALLPLLLFVFLASYKQHARRVAGVDMDAPEQVATAQVATAQQAAEEWATARAQAVASGMTATTRERLEAAIPELTDRDKLREYLDTLFSTQRADSISVTETTNAATAGAEAAVVRTVGLTEGDTWYTERDAKVCPICVPMHGRPRSVWSGYFPEGPPAHPRCRCWIQYAAEKQSQPQFSGV